jgi:hypothetical protein
VGRIASVLLLLSCGACSDHSVRPRVEPEGADFLPAVSAHQPTVVESPGGQDSVPWSDEDQPQLLLRCEGGRVNAYLVVGDSSEAGTQPASAEVPVSLDSAPPC